VCLCVVIHPSLTLAEGNLKKKLTLLFLKCDGIFMDAAIEEKLPIGQLSGVGWGGV
jgi:hypothetical protein